MEKIRKSAMELIGSTPLVELTNYEKKHQLKASVIAKLEYLNPAGSVKNLETGRNHYRTDFR